jgi:hypothetical protein
MGQPFGKCLWRQIQLLYVEGNQSIKTFGKLRVGIANFLKTMCYLQKLPLPYEEFVRGLTIPSVSLSQICQSADNTI